jgi:hypothetical protein
MQTEPVPARDTLPPEVSDELDLELLDDPVELARLPPPRAPRSARPR